MPTYKNSDLVKFFKTYFEGRKVTLGLDAVYYGDQALIPEARALCIEPGETNREWRGAPFRTNNELKLAFMVYVSMLDDVEVIQEATDELVEVIADEINQVALPPNYGGTQCNGLIINGLCTSVGYGYAMKVDKLMRADRIVFTAQTLTQTVE